MKKSSEVLEVLVEMASALANSSEPLASSKSMLALLLLPVRVRVEVPSLRRRPSPEKEPAKEKSEEDPVFKVWLAAILMVPSPVNESMVSLLLAM